MKEHPPTHRRPGGHAMTPRSEPGSYAVFSLRPSVAVHFLRDGLVVCKRVPARTRRGDCLFHLATDLRG